MERINFNGALGEAARIAHETSTAEYQFRLIRDIYGRISFAANLRRDELPTKVAEQIVIYGSSLGPYLSRQALVTRDDLLEPDKLFDSPEWQQTLVDLGDSKVVQVFVLERQAAGRDWAFSGSQSFEGSSIPRISFFSVKGGVGRSTALAVAAFHLAQQGKKLLLLDFDLESPGLGSLLLPPDRSAESGIVDWFVEDAVGQGSLELPLLVAFSPLTDQVAGPIRVAAAAGAGDKSYLSKLSRIYTEIPSENGPRDLAVRMGELASALEKLEKPDVVLIDSRGGLHDIAAVTLGKLSHYDLLFCTDSTQSWEGYRRLFEYWHQRPNVTRQVRKRLKMVQALFPESNQQESAALFRRKAWDLFRDNLYDELPAGTDELSDDVFSFDEMDEGAPHFPLRIRWSQRFLEFDPKIPEQEGGLNLEDIRSSFGNFLDGIDTFLAGFDTSEGEDAQ